MDAFEIGLPQRWLPDETLYSLCSRYHAASGHQLASTTCQALFGHPRQGCAHDFPARLDRFMAIAGPGLGSIRDIVEERTVLPLYLRFASADLAEMVVSAASQNSSGRLKFQLGLLTSRFRANHPLKGCPVCMTEDRHDHATAYWHREHQLPGVWVCRQHGCWLAASDLKATGVSRFHWLLPSPEQLGPTAETSPSPTALTLARMVAGVASRSEMRFTAQSLRLTYRTALKERNLLIGTDQRLRHHEAGERYAAFVAPLRLVRQLSGLPDSPQTAAAEVFRLIQPVRSGIHPLRHLTLASYLFRDPEEFFKAYGGVSALEASLEGEHAPAEIKSAASRVHPDKARFLDLVVDGHSVSAAAREVGVDTTTGLAWAAVHGIAVSRRPKLLKNDIRRAVIALLRQGVDKAQVAEHAKVSIQTITTLLRTEIGLHGAWKQAQFSVCSEISRASSTSIPRYRTVDSSLEWPSSSCTARRFLVRR